MKTTITGKNMVFSPGVSERVLKKTSKMERYLNPNTEIFVRLTREKNNRRTCEITVPFEGVVLRAEASNDDNLYVSIDQALAKLERQIHKHRTKLANACVRMRSNPANWSTTPRASKPSAKTGRLPRWCAIRPSRCAR